MMQLLNSFVSTLQQLWPNQFGIATRTQLVPVRMRK